MTGAPNDRSARHERLIPFDRAHARLVLSWARTPAERAAWASLRSEPTPAIFEEWLEDPDTHGRLLLVDGIPTGYGELWVSETEDEVELAHLLVAPKRRNRGVGRRLVRHLVEEASRVAVSTAWVRVVPDNAAAIRCYLAAGFAPASEAQEAELNAPQPRAYRWLRRQLPASRPVDGAGDGAPIVTLVDVDDTNRAACLTIRVRRDQEHLVPDVSSSLSLAAGHSDSRPLAIVTQGDGVVGFALYGLDDASDDWRIYRLLVDARHQRRGIGAAALERLVRTIEHEHAATRILVSYQVDNRAARALYSRFGFEEIDRAGAKVDALRTATRRGPAT